MKCPCKECISFAICYNRRLIQCTDLMYYLCGNNNLVLMWGSDQLNEVELLFKKRVDHTIATLNITVFKRKRLDI